MALSENTEELLRVVCDIGEIKSMRVALQSSVKAGVIVGATTTVCGLLLGPWGVALGGTLAGATTAYAMNGKFRSVPDVLINELNKAQQLRLALAVKNILTQQNILTIADFALKVATYDSVIGLLIPIVKSFLETDMRATIL
ncbi:protein C19orf12 homolog [Fopius arisanus]|uniref:CS012_1 protein n=1 Tax=Fopius arisanus TaxID=64838 RepID=A0A0C9R3G6_9HYME|nr:PREDICTED: protein C19orf12 homolog [Fopius arisanus]